MAIVQQDMQKTSLAGEGAHAGREQDGGTRGERGWVGAGLPASWETSHQPNREVDVVPADSLSIKIGKHPLSPK